MYNFQIHFSHPWILLLLIPAVFFTLLTYFRLSKKYRRNRNRIISIVLHLTAMVLAITGLAGLHFTYDEPNPENEVLLVVDVSYSNNEADQIKTDFVRSVIDGNDSSVKLGVVTFGYDQVYAAPLSYDMDEVYKNYRNAELPDDSATDISSALTYAKSLFNHPKTAKIVLLTDGVETDGDALSVIKSIAAEGVKVDVAYYPAGEVGNEVQLLGIEMPEKRIEVDDPVEITVNIQGSYASDAELVLYDNDVRGDTVPLEVINGTKTVAINHTFTEKGMHLLRFEIESAGDTVAQNNVYHSFINLEDFNRILILERTAGEADGLKEMLATRVVPEGEENYQLTTIEITDLANVPSTVKALRKFDQVVLVNIANKDMPVWENGVRFDEILNEYVYEYGGGMLTIGGNDPDETDDEGLPVANTYNRDDMYGTLYQEMLPVEAIDYTPPAGVMIIIDWSGSMSAVDGLTGKTYLELAKEGARSAVNALTERDYCGIVSLEDSYREEMKPIPLPKKEELYAAIDNLGEDQAGGGTVYQGAIEQAGSALKKLTVVERKHIILVTDGAPSDSYDQYKAAIQSNVDAGITMSIVLIGSGGNVREMQKAAETGGGRCHTGQLANIPEIMRTELELPEIKDVNHEPFVAQIDDTTSALKGITQADLDQVQLGGFYGTKIKPTAVQPLRAEYVPIYAEWNYGNGKVGSFMCDLDKSTWSANFIDSAVGQKFINNVVADLFPTTNIRSQEIEVKLLEDNYSTQVNIYPEKTVDGNTFDVKVESPVAEGSENPEMQEAKLEGGEFKKTVFAIKEPGVHTITVWQVNAEGKDIASCVTYKTLSYSEEYNMFFDQEECYQMLIQLAEDGDGDIITSAEEAFGGLVKVNHKTYDPILPFIISVLVLFLLDVAVRKFKFKWPHELIRERKAKKMLEKK